VIPPEKLKEIAFDTLYCGTMTGKDEIEEQLIELGIPKEKINKSYAEISVEARRIFLKCFSDEVYRYGISGNVAEAGVYRGDFAKFINEYFPDRICYLFDTFEGFDERDFKYEENPSLTQVTYMDNPDLAKMMHKMPNPDKIYVRKGYFPETAETLKDQFVFVNLDMDLYMPTLNGLKVFYPLMVKNGVILVHDYISTVYPNVRQAVEDYETELGISLNKIPIGDDLSLAIIK